MRRKSILVIAGLTILVAPLAALAQGPTGTVTTDPARQAPALAMPLLVVFVIAIAGFAMYRLRRPAAGPIVGLMLVVAVAVLAGLGYARPPGVTISGGECARETFSMFEAFGPAELMSQCPNPIQIVAIDLSCGGPFAPGSAPSPPVPECAVGQILSNGDICDLPVCGSPLP